MEPIVSVIMSTLNTKKEYLEEALKSILNQSYKNFEFIIIVDGGEDDQIIARFDDQRIKIIKHNESLGLTKSLNEGIAISKGKYIARMDSDDISFPNRFMKQVEFMEKNKDIDITSMFYKEIGNSTKNVYEVFHNPNELKCKLFFTNVMAHPAVMIRKEFLEKNKIQYNENYKYSQDFELWTRCSKIGKIAIIPEVGLKYRIHNNQISKEKFEIQSNLYYSILKRNLKELEIQEDKINYLLMLNGRNKVTDKAGLKEFIKLVLVKNKEKKIYEEKELKKILNIYYTIACIKSKKVFFLHFSFLEYIIRKLKTTIRRNK